MSIFKIRIKTYKVMFNGKVTLLQLIIPGSKKIIVKCDEKDKFDRKIGLGLALYRSKQDKLNPLNFPKQAQFLRENFKYKQIANFCLNEYTFFDKKEYKELCEQIESFEEGKWYYI